jgi:integrase/predicted Zn-ribbon and HTH transcriptional regulator
MTAPQVTTSNPAPSEITLKFSSEEADKAVKCPECGSIRSYKNGTRATAEGLVLQRFLCRDCGYRFINPASLNVQEANSGNRQLCAILQEAKKLDSQTETKTVCVGKKDSLIEYAWLLKKKGLGENTIKLRCFILMALQRKGADLTNPDNVETILATEPEYDGKNTVKYNTVKAYLSYTKTMKIFWEPIRVKYEAKQAFIPTPEELMLLLTYAGHVLGPFLYVTHDTGARVGEICRLKWIDVNTENHTISINNPEKNSRSRTIKVTEKTILKLQTLNKKYDPYIFNPNPSSMRRSFQDLRERLAREHDNPRLKQIHLHTFRYAFAHRLIKRGKHEKEVQQKLGHKSLSSTDRYTNTVVFSENDYETARASTVEEAEKLRSEGWEKFDEMSGVHLYSRLKP